MKEGAPIYTLRPWKNEGQWYLTKWADFGESHKEPLETYYIAAGNCGCPSPRRPCKHQSIKSALQEQASVLRRPLHMLAYQDGNIFIVQDMELPQDLTLISEGYTDNGKSSEAA